ncbi:hypothetical protein CERSUDRAFT_118840 [Gelatoporia subvermispora B]|uniref:WW domain-containing protein n=1 Tax=Ceriporiopsis subvermispora (strain B) TaxID=914234 RepID=M2P9R7_CERS8|nr:hypothetical protein CERSUDRAFT_118840 [Gelatoporia subvermispora B]
MSTSDGYTPVNESEDLPEGWEERYTPAGNRYFVDHNTRSTSWVDPRIRTASGKTLAELGPLPDGWEIRMNEESKIYFVNHNDKTTSWTDPRLSECYWKWVTCLLPHTL